MDHRRRSVVPAHGERWNEDKGGPGTRGEREGRGRGCQAGREATGFRVRGGWAGPGGRVEDVRWGGLVISAERPPNILWASSHQGLPRVTRGQLKSPGAPLLPAWFWFIERTIWHRPKCTSDRRKEPGTFPRRTPQTQTPLKNAGAQCRA